MKAGTPIVLALANGRPGLSYTTFSYGDIKLSQKPTSSAMKNSQYKYLSPTQASVTVQKLYSGISPIRSASSHALPKS